MKLATSFFVFLSVLLTSSGLEQTAGRKPAASTLRIVTEDLVRTTANDCAGCYYIVKGSIYNPSSDGIANVTINYYIWKKFIGHEDRGLVVRATGGLVTAHIKYIPPKQTVEFTAVGGGNVPAMTDTLPDPLTAEITADWDDK